MKKFQGIVVALCLGVGMLWSGASYAAKVKMKNCTDHTVKFWSFHKHDGARVSPYESKFVNKGKSKSLKCWGSKCHVRVFRSTDTSKKKTKTKIKGKWRVEYKNNKYAFKSGHTCD